MYRPLGLLENMVCHFRELDIREHDISGGWVGIIEKDSIWDGKRGIGGGAICRMVDLRFTGGGGNCSRCLAFGLGPSSHTSISFICKDNGTSWHVIQHRI